MISVDYITGPILVCSIATLCSIDGNCAVLKFEMFCLQSTKANGIRTLFKAAGKIVQCYMVLCYMMYQKDILYITHRCI